MESKKIWLEKKSHAPLAMVLSRSCPTFWTFAIDGSAMTISAANLRYVSSCQNDGPGNWGGLFVLLSSKDRFG